MSKQIKFDFDELLNASTGYGKYSSNGEEISLRNDETKENAFVSSLNFQIDQVQEAFEKNANLGDTLNLLCEIRKQFIERRFEYARFLLKTEAKYNLSHKDKLSLFESIHPLMMKDEVDNLILDKIEQYVEKAFCSNCPHPENKENGMCSDCAPFLALRDSYFELIKK